MSQMNQPSLPRALNLGCGEDVHSDAWNVDAVDLPGVDQQIDLDQYQWNLPGGHFREIRAHHVLEHLENIHRALEECLRLLESGGCLIMTLPVGQNARADSDHSWGQRGRPWTWQTPEIECGARHWDRDCGLKVVSKDVTLHSHYPPPIAKFTELKWWITKRTGEKGEWCFDQPASSGEFRIIFKKP